MPGARPVVFFAMIIILVSPALGSAQVPADTCPPYVHSSWMDDLVVAQIFNNSHDYRWYGAWDPKYDADWNRHYCHYSCVVTQACR